MLVSDEPNRIPAAKNWGVEEIANTCRSHLQCNISDVLTVEVKMPKAPVLTDLQVEAFHRDGFVLLREAFDDEDTKTIIRWADEVESLPEEPGETLGFSRN